MYYELFLKFVILLISVSYGNDKLNIITTESQFYGYVYCIFNADRIRRIFGSLI